MNQRTSDFIWFELLTRDTGAAARFYGNVLGWQARDAKQPGIHYHLLSAEGVDVGGLMALPGPEVGMPEMSPGWHGYVSVSDVDATVAKLGEAGGTILMAPIDLPGIGRMTMVADPQGAVFHLMQPVGTGTRRAFELGTPGHAGWCELHASDGAAAFAFYRDLLGWRSPRKLDMGELGSYLLLDTGTDREVGGVLTDAKAARPYWLYYFGVEDIEAAHTRILDHGGAVVGPPHEVPGGAWIVQATDPEGARFAVVGPKRTS